MKKWIVTHTPDAVNYRQTEIKGTSYTDAFVNFEIAYPGETVCAIRENENSSCEVKAKENINGLHP